MDIWDIPVAFYGTDAGGTTRKLLEMDMKHVPDKGDIVFLEDHFWTVTNRFWYLGPSEVHVDIELVRGVKT